MGHSFDPTVPEFFIHGEAIKLFDPKAFLAQAGLGRTVRHYSPKQAVFSQGDSADAVFYLQEGKVRLSVLSKQGKEATIALLGPGDFLGEGRIALRSTRPLGNSYRNYALLGS
jgi:CRP-like cAMP-binding protein